jgi:DNA repair exonuclease SbcCD ATPase subunit
MLEKITVKNWAAFESASKTLDQGSVLLTGDNGAGKSAFIEAIPYALFGIARKPIADMVRKDSDGVMSVRLDYERGHAIVRGRRADGKGVLKILDTTGDQTGDPPEKVIVQGEEAQAWIDNWLGYGKEMYLLTAYYKSRGKLSDNLLYVTSSERWSTLQRIAQLALYQRAEREAKAWRASVTRDVDQVTTRITMLNESMDDEDELKASITTATVGVKSLKEKKNAATAEQKARETVSREYNGAVNEVCGFIQNCESLKKRLSESERSQLRLETSVNTMRLRKEALEKKLAEYRGKRLIEKGRLEETLAKSVSEQAQLMVKTALLSTALEGVKGSFTACPLCSGPVSDHTVADWNKECADLRKRIVTLDQSISSDRKVLEADDTACRQVELTESALTEAINGLDAATKDFKFAVRDVTSARLALKAADEAVTDAVKKRDSLFKTLPPEPNPSVADLSHDLGNAESELAGLKADMEDLHAKKKKLKDSEAILVDHQVNLKAAEILTLGFGKYGIPKDILADFITRLGELATEAYSSFGSGVISVDVSEDEKPTVEFNLTDRKGKRDFESLSEGEQLMYYLSVRVALSQIMVEMGVQQVDWLILDEGMGCLTPENRDVMLRVITTTLKKVFPRLIVVSHVPVREVFDVVVTVTCENEVSHVA